MAVVVPRGARLIPDVRSLANGPESRSRAPADDTASAGALANGRSEADLLARASLRRGLPHRAREARPHGASALAVRGGVAQLESMRELILVVDDDATRLATVRDVLTTEETTATIACGMAEAMRELERCGELDAVVIDLDMHDGLVALARIESATACAVPVVALSRRPGRLIQAGIADAVVMKPFEVAHLRSCVARARHECRGAS